MKKVILVLICFISILIGKEGLSITGEYDFKQHKYYSHESKDSTIIEGYVYSGFTFEPLNKCFISVNGSDKILAMTDECGYFSINIPKGKYKFKFHSAGHTILLTDSLDLTTNLSSRITVTLGTAVTY